MGFPFLESRRYRRNFADSLCYFGVIGLEDLGTKFLMFSSEITGSRDEGGRNGDLGCSRSCSLVSFTYFSKKEVLRDSPELDLRSCNILLLDGKKVFKELLHSHCTLDMLQMKRG